jgi:hypothetical protein
VRRRPILYLNMKCRRFKNSNLRISGFLFNIFFTKRSLRNTALNHGRLRMVDLNHRRCLTIQSSQQETSQSGQLVTTIFSQAEIFRVTLSSDYNIHFMIINLFNVFLGVYFFCNKCAHAPLLSKKAGPIKLIRFVKYTQPLAF